MGFLTPSSPSLPPNTKYLLHVTAGPSYAPKTHTTVPVNLPTPTHITSPLARTSLRIRIKAHHGLPTSSPASSPYFSHPAHTSDLSSIAFSFVPARDIAGADLLMGFDVAHPVRDRLPPGTKAAVRIVTGVLDPGLSADPYADEPFVYGPAVSGVFALRVGEVEAVSGFEEQVGALGEEGVVEEGGDGSGVGVRDGIGCPAGVKERRKFFLKGEALERWVWQKGRVYHADFCNPHLDFAELALRVPGLKVGVAGYVGEKTHQLRFVLKEKKGGEEEVAFVVAFTLLFGKEGEEVREREERKGGREGVAVGKGDAGGEEKRRDGNEKRRDEEEKRRSERTDPHPHPHPPKDISASTYASPSHHSNSAPAPAVPASTETPKDTNDHANTESPPGALNTATSTLTTSISAVFAALGFGASSDSATSNGDDSSPPRRPSAIEQLDAQVDQLSDETMARYLQNRHSSLS